MTDATQKPDDAKNGGHMMDEPDIGSGERTPAQKETDEQIRNIPSRTPPPAPDNGGKA